MAIETVALTVVDPTASGVPPCGTADEATWLCETVLDATGNPRMAQAADLFVARPLSAAFVLLIAFVVHHFLRRAIGRLVHRLKDDTAGSTVRRIGRNLLDEEDGISMLRRAQRAETVGALLRSLASVAVWSVAVLVALGELGLNLGPLIAGAGIIGVAVGFGSQSLVKDFLSGIFMTIEDQYGVGDVIDVGDVSGSVESVSLRTTRLRDINGVVWHVPNGEIRRVGNKSQHWSRALLDVPVAHGTDLGLATAVIQEAADSLADDPSWKALVLERPEVWGVERFEADGLAIRVGVKTAPLAQWPVSRELRRRLKEAFEDRGIAVPVTYVEVGISQPAPLSDG